MKSIVLAGLILSASAVVTLPINAQTEGENSLVNVLNNASTYATSEQLEAGLLAAIADTCSDCTPEQVNAMINDVINTVGTDSPFVANALAAMANAGIDSDVITLAAVSVGVDATVASEATAAGQSSQPTGGLLAARSRVSAPVSLPTPPGAGGTGGDNGISEVSGN